MTNSAADIARALDLGGKIPACGGTYNELHQSLAYFRTSRYDQYVPTLGSEHSDFEARLFDWLSNVSVDDQRASLLELASKILFFTREDFAKLHTAAIRGPVYRWLIDALDLSLDEPTLESLLSEELEQHTWFTSITDSMPISDFHHVNRLGGIDHRPDWRSLAEFGDVNKIRKYMDRGNTAHKEIRRIVILEDFVGSGTQMKMGTGSVEFAARAFKDIPILLLPLIICPEGLETSRQLATRHNNLTLASVLEISQDHLISPKSDLAPGGFENGIVDLSSQLETRLKGRSDAPYYGPWGFHETGAIIVLYSNAPANTLPIIQHASETWSALFPRSARIR